MESKYPADVRDNAADVGNSKKRSNAADARRCGRRRGKRDNRERKEITIFESSEGKAFRKNKKLK